MPELVFTTIEDCGDKYKNLSPLARGHHAEPEQELLHAPLQPPHPPLQLPEQPYPQEDEQEPLHPPEQLQLQPISFCASWAWLRMGI